MYSRRTRYVELSPEQIAYAYTVGEGRNKVAPAKRLVSGEDMVRADIIGAMAEIGVCVYYQESIAQVRVYAGRPGCSPDLVHGGYKVSVKATERWGNVRLIVPEDDTNDIFILASVRIEGVVGLRGWLTRKELHQRKPTWIDLGKQRDGRLYRYVPVEELRRCLRQIG